MKAFSETGKACLCQVPSSVRMGVLPEGGCKLCKCKGCHPEELLGGRKPHKPMSSHAPPQHYHDDHSAAAMYYPYPAYPPPPPMGYRGRARPEGLLPYPMPGPIDPYEMPPYLVSARPWEEYDAYYDDYGRGGMDDYSRKRLAQMPRGPLPPPSRGEPREPKTMVVVLNQLDGNSQLDADMSATMSNWLSIFFIYKHNLCM
eukprot:gene12065-14116_t